MEEFENPEETPERLAEELHGEFLNALPRAIQTLCELYPGGFTVAQLREWLEQQYPALKGFLNSSKVLFHLNQVMAAQGLQTRLPQEDEKKEKVNRYVRKEKPVAEPTVPETDKPLKPTKELCGGVGSGPAKLNCALPSDEDEPITTPAPIELPHHKKERRMADKKRDRQKEGKNGGDDPVDRRIKWLMRLSFLVQEAVERGDVSEEAVKACAADHDPVFKHDVARAQYEKERAAFEKRATAIEAVYHNFIETSDEAATEVFKLIRRASDETLLALCAKDAQMVKTWRGRNANQWQDQPPTDVMALVRILKTIRPAAARQSELNQAAVQAALATAAKPQDAAEQPSTEPSPNEEKDVKDPTEPGKTEDPEVIRPPDDPAAEAPKAEDKPAATDAAKGPEAAAATEEPAGTETPPGSTSKKPSLAEEIRFARELADTKDDLREVRLELEAANAALTTASGEKKTLEGLFAEERNKCAKLDEGRVQFVKDCIILGLDPDSWAKQVRELKKAKGDLAAAQAAANEHLGCAARITELEGQLTQGKTELEEERAKAVTSVSMTQEEIDKLLAEINDLKSRSVSTETTTPKGESPMAEAQKDWAYKIAMIKNRLYPQLAPDSCLKYADDVLAGMPETAIDAHIAELQQEIAKRDEIAKLAKRAFKMQGQLNDPKKAQGLDDLKGDSKEDLEEYIEQLEEAIEAKEKAEEARPVRVEVPGVAETDAPATQPARPGEDQTTVRDLPARQSLERMNENLRRDNKVVAGAAAVLLAVAIFLGVLWLNAMKTPSEAQPREQPEQQAEEPPFVPFKAKELPPLE